MADNIQPRTEPVVTITEIANGAPVSIFGKTYELKHPNSLSLGRYNRMRQLGVDIDALERKPQLTEEEDARLTQLLSDLVAIVLVAPADVQAKLNDQQRGQIIHAFMELRQPSAPVSAAGAKPQSTGATRSRGSRASTAARRTRGTGTSLSV